MLVVAITALQSQARGAGARAAEAGDKSFMSPVPGPGDAARCCRKLASGCVSACFRGAGSEGKEKDLLEVPTAPSQVWRSAD